MATRVHPTQNDVPMLVTTNTVRRLKFFANPSYAREAVDVLYRVQVLHPFFLYAFVVMPDHMHVLLNIPAPGSVSKIMNRCKMGISHSIGVGQIWQPHFHIRVVENLHETRQYIHLNPVRAGIVECSGDYPWSSASGRWDVSPIEIF